MYRTQFADVANAYRTDVDPVGSAAVGRTALADVEQAYASAGRQPVS